MFGVIVQMGLMLLLAERSRRITRQKAQVEELEGAVAAKDAEVGGIKERLDSMPGSTKRLLRKMDKEGRSEVARRKKELQEVNDSFRPRIAALEREIGSLRGLDASKIYRRVQELQGIHLAMQKKIAKRDEVIKELEDKLARRRSLPTTVAVEGGAGSSC